MHQRERERGKNNYYSAFTLYAYLLVALVLVGGDVGGGGNGGARGQGSSRKSHVAPALAPLR